MYNFLHTKRYRIILAELELIHAQFWRVQSRNVYLSSCTRNTNVKYKQCFQVDVEIHLNILVYKACRLTDKTNQIHYGH